MAARLCEWNRDGGGRALLARGVASGIGSFPGQSPGSRVHGHVVPEPGWAPRGAVFRILSIGRAPLSGSLWLSWPGIVFCVIYGVKLKKKRVDFKVFCLLRTQKSCLEN